MIPSIEIMALTLVSGAAAGGIIASVGWKKHVDQLKERHESKLDDLAKRLVQVAIDHQEAKRKLSAGGVAKAAKAAAARQESAQRTVDELIRKPLPPRDEVVAGVVKRRQLRVGRDRRAQGGAE